MEDTELEEGVACFDDNDASIDPDTALSYIDKRLQNVLGHFQKDFEGGISAEILGPKYGGYGSFLPSQKQVPTVHSHIKTPQRVLNPNKVEGAPLNSIIPTELALAFRPPPASTSQRTHAFLDHNALSVDNSVCKDTTSLRVSTAEPFLPKNETTTSDSANPTGPISLKVRLKVGSDKSARKNAAIYSGLGLSSPSSSMGNDPEHSDGPSNESHDFPLDSPGSILRDMTSIIVPGNRLLSPLNERLLCLIKTERVLQNKPTPHTTARKVKSSSFLDDSSSVHGDGKSMEGKEVISQDKSEKEGMKYKASTSFETDKAPFLGKRMETESFDGKKCLTSDLKVNPPPNSALCTGDMLNLSEANRTAKKDVPVKKRETKKEWINDQLFGPDLKESEQKDVKCSSSNEMKAKASTKKVSLDSKGNDRTKGNIVHSKGNIVHSKNDPDVCKRVEKKVAPKAVTRESHEVKVPHGADKLPLERKNKLMGIQSSRCGLSGAMKDKKSAQKDIVKVRNSYKDILDTRVEEGTTQKRELKIHTDNGSNQGKHIPINGIPAESADPLQIQVAPAAPRDNWVGCDRCEKWRLLPIGIGPENLPDKWLCSMLTWLPGRNHCDISEDETTREVQEMNLQLISRTQNTLQHNGCEAISGLPSVNIGHSDHTSSNLNSEAMPDRLKKNKIGPEATSHLSQKRKCSSEANQPLVEKNAVNKSTGLHPSKSSNFSVGRHAAKVNVKDVSEVDLKPKKQKSKAGSDQNERDMEQESEQLQADNKDQRSRDRLVISVKRQTESTQLSMKSQVLGSGSSEKVEMHTKKRKLKDWQESRPLEGSESSDKIVRKEKRLKTSNTGINDSVAIKDNDRCTSKGKTMKIILPGSKENSIDRSHEKNHQQDNKHRDKGISGKKLESQRFLLAATSSSSKVSDSCKRVCLQERKGSPVGSVSSSPLRAQNLDNHSPSARTISRKGGSGTQIPRKLPPREDNMKGISDIDASQRFGGKAELKHKETSKNRDKDLGKESLSRSRDKDQRCSIQRVKVKRSDSFTDQEPFPNKIRKVEVVHDAKRDFSNDSSAKISNDDKGIIGKKICKRRTSDNITGDEKPTSLMDHGLEPKLDEKCSSEVVKKVSKKVVLGDASKTRDSNELEQKVEGGNLNVKSVVNSCGTMKDLSVISFIKEYASSQTAMTAFKRAEESKDYADRIKISGFDYECNDAYFDSALKFLYAAFLLETCSNDYTKPKGVDPVNVYNTCAKLSKTCAQEYEKQKEMGAAALAYKCMEVAYMKIVYCKSSVTRQDLQTSLQMVTQGESPSSSASDVDNLNNQATMLSKGIAPPGNHLVARNQANFLRLLDFTSDVNLAMEGSRNTQKAYSEASSMIQESTHKEMMISMKRVIEFSFQDVKELVILVQSAREAINRQGFKGKKME